MALKRGRKIHRKNTWRIEHKAPYNCRRSWKSYRISDQCRKWCGQQTCNWFIEKIRHQKSNIIGDKAYGSKEIRSYITENGKSYTIPPKSNTKDPWACDYYLYKERHLVECFFQKLKWFRRIATRYDTLDSSFLSFVYLASIMILLKWYNYLDFSNKI